MSEDEWVKEAMTNDMLVAEVLLSLGQAESASPPPEQSAKNNSSSSALQLEWSVRQSRYKQDLRKKGEPPQASPTTPLSWSSGTSDSGCCDAKGSGESSRPPSKPVDNSKSKVEATDKTTPPMRSRKKKTLAELKQEMSPHFRENKSLKIELEMVKLKLENLITTNESLSRELKFEKERTTNESSKRMKATETATALVEPKNAISDLSQQREVAYHAASVGCNKNDPAMQNESYEAQDDASCETSFMLPDLNLPIESDSSCNVLHRIS